MFWRIICLAFSAAILLAHVLIRSSNHEGQSTFWPPADKATMYEAVSVSRCTTNVESDCLAV